MPEVNIMIGRKEQIHHVSLTREELLVLATKGYIVKFQEDDPEGIDVISLDIQGVYKNDKMA